MPLSLQVIAEKVVDLYARDSGVRDKLVVEHDVVLTYALRGSEDAGRDQHSVFKGVPAFAEGGFGSAWRIRRGSASLKCQERRMAQAAFYPDICAAMCTKKCA